MRYVRGPAEKWTVITLYIERRLWIAHARRRRGRGAHLLGSSVGRVVLIVAGMRPDLVRTLVIIKPPAISLVGNSRPALELGRRLIDHFEKCQDMPNIKFARKFFVHARRQTAIAGD